MDAEPSRLVEEMAEKFVEKNNIVPDPFPFLRFVPRSLFACGGLRFLFFDAYSLFSMTLRYTLTLTK